MLRHLHLVSPAMQGDDVKRLQRKLNVHADGEYGPVTARAVRARKRDLGFPSRSLDRGASVFFQQVLFGDRRTPAAYKARARAEAVKDRARRKRGSDGAQARARACTWMVERAGKVRENSIPNRGPEIDGWQVANGHGRFQSSTEPGWPWCGVAVWAAYKYGAGVTLPGEVRSVQWIFNQAESSVKPFRFVGLKDAVPGDLVILFGSGTHVGMIRQRYQGGSVRTVEGNTSSGSSGSQSNGGGLFLRDRAASDVIAVVRVL